MPCAAQCVVEAKASSTWTAHVVWHARGVEQNGLEKGTVMRVRLLAGPRSPCPTCSTCAHEDGQGKRRLARTTHRVVAVVVIGVAPGDKDRPLGAKAALRTGELATRRREGNTELHGQASASGSRLLVRTRHRGCTPFRLFVVLVLPSVCRVVHTR